MRALCLLALALCAACAPGRRAGPAVGAGLALTHVAVVDVETGQILPDQTVLIAGSRIRAAGPAPRVRVPRGARVVDASGRYLIPGLWEMHAHLFDVNEVERGAHDPTAHLPLFVVNGVTGVREMGSGLADIPRMRAWSDAARRGGPVTPRIVVGSPIVDGSPPQVATALAVATAAEARSVVDSLVRGGAGFIKVYNNLSREAYFAILERARQQQVPVDGHVPFSVHVAEAADSGQRSLEHLRAEIDGCSRDAEEMRRRSAAWQTARERGAPPAVVDSLLRDYRLGLAEASPSAPECQALLRHLALRGTWHTPTHVNRRTSLLGADSALVRDPRLRYVPVHRRERWMRRFAGDVARSAGVGAELERREVEQQLDFIAAMQRAGVRLLAGTDMGVSPWKVAGFSLHDELGYLVEAGLTPLEALRTATLNPARFLEATDSLGSVAPGKLADLVLLDANPLDDIRNTRRIHAVVLDGRFLDRAALDDLLLRAEAAARAPTR